MGGAGRVVTTYTVNSEVALQNCFGDIREQWRRDRYLKVTVKAGKDRSSPQNAISHAWYEQVARELREDDALGVKCFAKLHFGVPILRAEDEEFRAAYDAAIKGLTYEQKVKVMSILPVTSLMTRAQLSRYLEDMQAHYATRGVRLEFPEPPCAS
jgi:hypothetical protein